MIGMYENIGHIILMLILICFSAFFSGAETAFFNLTRRQINLMRKSSHRLQTLVIKILSKPKKLLGSLLFGNMLVNVLFFALASIVVMRIENNFGVTPAAAAAIICFAVLVLCGEILPKSIAYANSKTTSTATAVPTFLCMKIFNHGSDFSLSF